MSLPETKRILPTFFGLLALIVVVFVLPQITGAVEISSDNFKIEDPVIDAGLGTATSTNFGLGQSLSQSASGLSTSTSFQLWSGFQYFYEVTANTLTPTAGDGQVSLSWTVPSTFLGISVDFTELLK